MENRHALILRDRTTGEPYDTGHAIWQTATGAWRYSVCKRCRELYPRRLRPEDEDLPSRDEAVFAAWLTWHCRA